MAKGRANYGIDAPWITYGFFFGGIALIILEFSQSMVKGLIYPGVSFGATGALMLWGSLVGKQKVRDRVIASLPADYREVLDIGCGHGLMLIGAAKHLPSAHGVGLDLWNKVDQAGNSREATMQNAEIEGVADRVELVDGDARNLPFEPGRFDAVVSSLAIHNIPDAAGRKQAILEAARVLKPGGRMEIVDIFKYREYERTLKEADWKVEMVRVSGYLILTTCWVRGIKPI